MERGEKLEVYRILMIVSYPTCLYFRRTLSFLKNRSLNSAQCEQVRNLDKI